MHTAHPQHRLFRSELSRLLEFPFKNFAGVLFVCGLFETTGRFPPLVVHGCASRKTWTWKKNHLAGKNTPSGLSSALWAMWAQNDSHWHLLSTWTWRLWEEPFHSTLAAKTVHGLCHWLLHPAYCWHLLSNPEKDALFQSGKFFYWFTVTFSNTPPVSMLSDILCYLNVS